MFFFFLDQTRPISPDATYFILHLVRVLQPFRSFFQNACSGVFEEENNEAALVKTREIWESSSFVFNGRTPTEKCSRVWARIMGELGGPILLWQEFRHFQITMMDYFFYLYSKTPKGKRNTDYILWREASAFGEGHSKKVKKQSYWRTEEEDAQPIKDHYSGRPCEVLMWATGTDHRRRGIGANDAPLPSRGPTLIRGVRHLDPIVRVHPRAVAAAKLPDMRETMRKFTKFKEFLSEKQERAAALCWWDSPVLFRQVFLPTGAGKTLALTLGLLAAPENRAILIVSMSRAQIEGTRDDILSLYSTRCPHLKVRILRPSLIAELRNELNFVETRKLSSPVILLICIESFDEFADYAEEAALINRTLYQLRDAGLLDQVITDEAHAFDSAPSCEGFRPALKRYPNWLGLILGRRLEEIRVPHTVATGTPGDLDSQQKYWRTMLPDCFAMADDSFSTFVSTVSSDPCRYNVVVDVKDWDHENESAEQMQLQLKFLADPVTRTTAKSSAIIIQRMAEIGALHLSDDDGVSYLSCNVLICFPSVAAVVGLREALAKLGLPRESIHVDWAANEESPGLENFRFAENAVCISTTR